MAGSITQKHTRVMQGQVSAAPHIHQRASSSSSLNSACMKRTSFEGEREVMRARSAFYAWPRWYSTLCGSDSEWHAGWLAVAAHPTELGWDSSSICLTMHLRIWNVLGHIVPHTCRRVQASVMKMWDGDECQRVSFKVCCVTCAARMGE
jgi:hypothetical protein